MDSNTVRQLEREFDSTLINHLISMGFLSFSLIDKGNFCYSEERDETHHSTYYVVSLELEGKRYSQLFVLKDGTTEVRPVSNIIIETATTKKND